MITGFTTWDELAAFEGPALLIVTSPLDAIVEVTTAFEELARLAKGGVHIIAGPSWKPWIVEHGIGSDRVLYTADAQGRDLEMNFFLETAPALAWIRARRMAVIAGTIPHGLYNEEVKTIFEQRVGLILGAGRFLVHALPERGLYLFDLPAIITRLGRESKLRAYQATCEAMMKDLYQTWRDQGSPAPADGADCVEVAHVLSRHLGAAVLDFDEQTAIPLPANDDVSLPAAEFVRHLVDVIADRDEVLRQAAQAAREAALSHEAALAERRDPPAVPSSWFSRLFPRR